MTTPPGRLKNGLDNLILLPGGSLKTNRPAIFPGGNYGSHQGDQSVMTGYYSPPRIIQFQAPDTIIPDPGNPLDFNRYGYARYNPLRYSDPSGHICVDTNKGTKCTEDDDSRGWWADTGQSCRVNPHQPACWGKQNPDLDWKASVRNAIWKRNPRTAGYTSFSTERGGTMPYSEGIWYEQYAYQEVGLGFNAVDGSFFIIKTSGSLYQTGTPTIEGGGFSINVYRCSGLSLTQHLADYSQVGGVTVGPDVSLNPFVGYERGVSTTSNGAILNDRISKQPIQTTGFSLGSNVNFAANALDVAIYKGQLKSNVSILYTFPFWPIRDFLVPGN